MATQSDFRVKKGLIVGTTDTANPESGTFTYDADFETVDLTLDANVNARLAQDHYFYVKAGATITKGDVVYASGAVGNSGKIEASPYIANNTIEETLVLGVAAEDIATGNFGYVAQFGSIRGLDASGGLTTDGETWNDGDILYASSTYAGELTKTKPSAPNQDIPIAFVISDNGSNGTIAVRASRLGYHMDEVHDVEITSIADKDLLVYNTSNSRWENGKTLGDITTGTISASDVTLTGELNGPATFYIDPAPHDPDTDGATNGLVVIRGDLQVDGTTTTVNSTTVEVADKNIVLGANATADTQNDGAGITVTQPDSTDAQIYWDQSNSDWSVTNGLRIYGPHPTNNFNGQLIIKGTETDGLIGSGGGINFYFDNGANGGETRGGPFIYAGKENNTAGDDDSYLSFGTRQEGSDPEVRMHIASDGKVGIGTDDPSNKLHIKGPNTSGRGQVTIEGDGDNVDPRLSFYGFNTSSAFANTSSYGLDIFVDTSELAARYDVPTGMEQWWTVQGSPVIKLDQYGDLKAINDGHDYYVHKRIDGWDADASADNFLLICQVGDTNVRFNGRITAARGSGASASFTATHNLGFTTNNTGSVLGNYCESMSTYESGFGSSYAQLVSLTYNGTNYYAFQFNGSGQDWITDNDTCHFDGHASSNVLFDVISTDVVTVSNVSLVDTDGGRKIFMDQRIGIATASPESKLHVYGSDILAGKPDVNNSAYYGLLGIRTLGSGLGGYGMHFESGYENPIIWGYDAGAAGRNIRFATMTSASSRNLGDALVDRMVIDTHSGNVGIGTTSPNYPLEVEATGTSSTDIVGFSNSNGVAKHIFGLENVGAGTYRLLDSSNNNAVFFSGHSADNSYINAGNVGIGEDNPSERLHIGGDVMVDAGGSGNTASIKFVNDNERSRITSNYDSGGGGRLGFWTDTTGGSLLQRMTINNNGDVDVVGAFSAASKSFDIEHPTKEGMRLHHGSLEGPEHGVYIRGRLKDNNVIELPDYWIGLVDEDTITVQLTAMGSKQDLWVEDIADNTIIVGSDANINCFYFIQAERKDVDKFDVEYVDGE